MTTMRRIVVVRWWKTKIPVLPIRFRAPDNMVQLLKNHPNQPLRSAQCFQIGPGSGWLSSYSKATTTATWGK